MLGLHLSPRTGVALILTLALAGCFCLIRTAASPSGSARTVSSRTDPELFLAPADPIPCCSRYDYARTLFLSGQLARAEAEFRGLLRSAESELIPPDTIAAYLGFIAQALGDTTIARHWYECAKTYASPDRKDDLEFYDCLYSLASVEQNTEHRTESVVFDDPAYRSFTFVSLSGTTAIGNDRPDHSDSHKVYRHLVQPAQREVDEARRKLQNAQQGPDELEKAVLEAEIKLASAILLHAELLSRQKESLYTTANDHFEKGLELYRRIRERMQRDPNLETWLAQHATIAMRFDAIHARMRDIQKKEQVSRDKERQRLTRLRTLVQQYRDCASRMAEGLTGFVTSDRDTGFHAFDEALEAFGRIRGIVEDNRDYYLMAEEPTLDDPDDQIVWAPTPPFTERFESQLAALAAAAGMGDFVFRQSVPAETLDKVEGYALQSIQEGTGDPKNALGHYVLGLVYEARGLARTQRSPADSTNHADAKKDFVAARKHFELAEKSLSLQAVKHDEHDGVAFVSLRRRERHTTNGSVESVNVGAVHENVAPVGTTSFVADIRRHVTELTNGQSFLDQAAKLTFHGDVEQAFESLNRGLLRHSESRLWYAWVETGLRTNRQPAMLAKEFAAARTSGIVPEDDYRTHLIAAKISLAELADVMAKEPLEAIDESKRQQLAQQALDEADRLQSAKSLSKDDDNVSHAEINAYWALAYAFASILAPNNALKQLPTAYERAREAGLILLDQLKTEKNTLRRSELQEALVASRLAQGHIAIKILPSYRDDATVAFAAALDHAVQLPYRPSNLKVLGAPLLHAMQGRAEAADRRVLFEERSLRQAMHALFEGSYALYFGDTEASERQLNIAGERFAQLQKQDNVTPQLPSADVLIEQSDGVEQFYADPRIRSYTILTLREAKRYDSALAVALGLSRNLTPASNEQGWVFDHKMVTDAVNKISNAFDGYSLAAALEGRVIGADIGPLPDREFLLDQARRAVEISHRSLTADMARRYPVLARQLSALRDRLSGPEFFLKRAAELRGQFRLEQAYETLRDGLRLYPQDKNIWHALLRIAEDRVGVLHARDTDIKELSDLVAKLEEIHPDARYEITYWRARIRELQRDLPEARALYERAHTMAEDDDRRLLTRARTVLINLTETSSGPVLP